MSGKVKYSVFVAFSRLWLADDFLRMFDALDIPKDVTEVCFYNDTEDQALYDKLHSWMNNNHGKWVAVKLFTSNAPRVREYDVPERRDRIVTMKKNSVQMIGDSEYVFCLEDDTFVEPDTFKRLLGLIEDKPGVGVVSGVEVGRWNIPVYGVWKIDPLDKPTKVSTMPHKDSGIQEVDGLGWYCYITPTKLYKEADYHYEAECIGPDVAFTLDLRRRGYKALADWSIKCKHVSRHGILEPNSEVKVAEWGIENGLLKLQKIV